MAKILKFSGYTLMLSNTLLLYSFSSMFPNKLLVYPFTCNNLGLDIIDSMLNTSWKFKPPVVFAHPKQFQPSLLLWSIYSNEDVF